MDLSILIPAVPDRVASHLARLLAELDRQTLVCWSELQAGTNGGVEILALVDNYQHSVGTKRNRLLQMANGKFVTFVDDDDWISERYLSSIIGAIRDRADADVIVYQVECTTYGTNPYVCNYSLDYEYSRVDGRWFGKPAHTMVWNAAIAKQCQFPETNFGEDMAWVKQACALARREHRINDVLYHYRYNPDHTRTRDGRYTTPDVHWPGDGQPPRYRTPLTGSTP